MNRSLVFAALALVPLLVFAQKEPNGIASRPPGVITRMIRLQHADPRQVRSLLLSTGAQVSDDSALRVVVISGTPSDVASLEQTIKELDAETAKIQSSNVQMTVYVVGASPNADGAGQIPQGLQSTVNQLKQLFPYASYQLLETTVTRARVGENAAVQGTLQPFDGQAGTFPPSYGLQFTVASITNSGPSAAVHVSNFNFNANFPLIVKRETGSSTTNLPTSIRTNIDVTTGQKVVVGKAGAGGANAIFLIVEAKVVD
ncbi:MAG: secretin N-terminal domain-containing protein [Bryobacteraceae bacterium]